MQSATEDVKLAPAPAPWLCSAQVYSTYFFNRASSTALKDVETVAYCPLERGSYFASTEAGRLVGGLGALMVIRYTDTPVGPYDELIICPGSYVYQIEENGEVLERRNLRVSRVYVSSKASVFNGRNSMYHGEVRHPSYHNESSLLSTDWNIPKHLARFDWKCLADGTMQVHVFPHDTGLDGTEAEASSTPLFKAAFKTLPLVPAFPLSTSWAKYLGLDLNLVQPPVPQGTSREVVGTDRWCKVRIPQSSSSTHIGWFDISQRDDNGRLDGLFENFMPGLGRWHLGVRMDDAILTVPEGLHWESAD